MSTVQSHAADAPVEEVVKSIIESYLDFLSANPEAVRLLQWESLNPAKTRQKAPFAVFDDAVQLLEKCLKRSGYTHVNPRFLLLSIVSMCFFPFGIAETFKGKPALLNAYKKHILKIVLSGVRGLR